MNNYSKIYWLTRLDNIQVFFITALSISIFIFFAYHVIKGIECDWDEEKENFEKAYGKYKTISFWTSIIAGFILVFMPTKTDIILIYAGGKTMGYVQTDTSLSKIPYQTTAIISKYLDNSIKEMEKKD